MMHGNGFYGGAFSKNMKNNAVDDDEGELEVEGEEDDDEEEEEEEGGDDVILFLLFVICFLRELKLMEAIRIIIFD